MFESREKLGDEITRLLEVVRAMAQGRYACVVAPSGIVFESTPEPPDDAWMLRQFLKDRSAALFTLPAAMDAGGPSEDVFADWSQDEFFLAFFNRRVALVVACAEAEPLREGTPRLLKALADRLFRYDASWRIGAQGQGGLFFGRAQLDVLVIGRES
jgi:hypothetical protein